MKKILYVLLAVIISLNILDECSVKASAVAGAATAGGTGGILYVIGDVIKDLSGEALKNSESDYLRNINENALSNGEFVKIVEDNGKWKFYSNVPLQYVGTDVEEFANFYADYLNNHYSPILTSEFMTEYSGDDFHIPCNTYKNVKDAAGKAFENYLKAKEEQKRKLEADLEGGDTLTEVDGLASYNFDFVGPLPYMTLPTSSGYVQADVKGFHLMTPHPCTEQMQVERCFASVEEAINYGAQEKLLYSNGVIGNGIVRNGSYTYENSYVGNLLLNNVYAWGYYIIYNGELFYHCIKSHIDTPYTDQLVNAACEYSFNSLGSYFNSHSISLQAIGCRSYIGLNYGIYYATQPVTSDFPMDLLEDDLTDSSGGTVSIPRKSAEDIIGQAEAVGLINKDSLIELDEDGNIISVAGIPIDTLKAALEKITEGNMEFENYDDYYKQVIQLLSRSNIGVSEIEAIQTSLLELEESQTKSLEDIKESLKEITKALEAEKEVAEPDNKFDVKTPASITDKFPFSLPFDVQRMFNLLSAEPKAPKWDFEIDMTTVGGNKEKISVDLSQYEWIAEIIRWLIYAAAVIGLILATNKIIGRG